MYRIYEICNVHGQVMYLLCIFGTERQFTVGVYFRLSMCFYLFFLVAGIIYFMKVIECLKYGLEEHMF